MLSNFSKDDFISAVRGINLKDYTIKDMVYLMDLFKIKSRQMEDEIRKRKLKGEE